MSSVKNTPAYHTMRGMKQRCFNKNHVQYKDYGGRGITICDEWLNDVSVFSRWAIANGYEKGLTIERINVDGNYTPLNCTFITRAENNTNKRVYLTNKLGVKNISCRSNGSYRVLLHVNKKRINVGHFKTLTEAIFARDSYDPSIMQEKAFKRGEK